MKEGDLVLKKGDLDKNKKGVILKISKPNQTGNLFAEVLREDGVVVTWYLNLVEAVDEI